MNRIQFLRPAPLTRRVTVILAGLTASLLAISAASPAAFAYVLPPHPAGGTAGLPVHIVVTGGMPGWQIALIAAAAAAFAAVGAVLLDRARGARRHQTAPSA